MIPCWEYIERKSPLDKFYRLCEALKVVDLPKKEIETIQKLFIFRNTIAHARTTVIESPAKERFMSKNQYEKLGNRICLKDWEKKIKSEKFAKRARDDVKKILEELHKARPEPKDALFMSGMEITSVTPV
jgi:hypothetical protein